LILCRPILPPLTRCLAERAARVEAEAVAACAQAVNVSTRALIAHLKLEIEKLRRALYGSHSERKARLLEQMELQLEDLEAAATEDELAAEKAAARAQTVQSFQRKRPPRKPFPDHLPHERIVIAAPESCPCCGSTKLSKLGEDSGQCPARKDRYGDLAGCAGSGQAH
jgi:transposase